MNLEALNFEARLTSDDPDQQVADAIELMSRYAREDSRSEVVLDYARRLAPPSATPEEVAESVFWAVKRLIRFQTDESIAAPLGSHLASIGAGEYPVVEVLIRPRDMLTWSEDTGSGQVGDCDDFAMLVASLLLARGIRASFVTVAADPAAPNQWSHVYVAAYLPSGRLALDASHGGYPGWETGRVWRRQEWPVESDLRGLLIAVLLGLIVWLSRRAVWADQRRQQA